MIGGHRNVDVWRTHAADGVAGLIEDDAGLGRAAVLDGDAPGFAEPEPALPDGARAMVTFPLPLSARVTHALVVDNLRALGFVRVLADGRELHLEELEEGEDLTAAGELLVVVDRLRLPAEDTGRLADSVQTAFTEGEGEAVAVPVGGELLRFTESFRCPDHPEIVFATPTPQLFSFNNPYGSCPECTGFGAVLSYDPALIVPNESRTLGDGAVDPWSKPRYESRRGKLAEFAR